MNQTCHTEQHDAELRAYDPGLIAAAAVRRGEHVLDIGCGTGRSTRDAALSAAPGRVVGLDVSEQSLERARQLSAAEQLDNVTYVHGDAQTLPFGGRHYDVAISRFGVMFFSDPVAAFANIASALRPDGRLALVVWQSRERNEWAAAFEPAGGSPARIPTPTRDAFSLGDPVATEAILQRAGFRSIHFDDIQAPIYFGREVADAFEFVRSFQDTSEGADPVDEARLRETLAAHHTAEHGVAFDSRAWLITARNSPD